MKIPRSNAQYSLFGMNLLSKDKRLCNLKTNDFTSSLKKNQLGVYRCFRFLKIFVLQLGYLTRRTRGKCWTQYTSPSLCRNCLTKSNNNNNTAQETFSVLKIRKLALDSRGTCYKLTDLVETNRFYKRQSHYSCKGELLEKRGERNHELFSSS